MQPKNSGSISKMQSKLLDKFGGEAVKANDFLSKREKYDEILHKEDKGEINGVQYTYIDIAYLIPSKDNEIIFKLDNIDEFAESMKEGGFEQSSPLGVYELKDKKGYYEIYSGHRRYYSALKAGFKEVPCVIKEEPSSRAEKIADLIRANLQNRKYTPLVMSLMITVYRDECLKNEVNKRKKLSVVFGLSEATIQRYESISKLIEPLKGLTDYEDIPYSAISSAVTLSEDKQLKLYDMIMDYINTKMNGEYRISKDRVLALIETLKNDVVKKPKPNTERKSSDKKALSAVKAFENIAKQKSIVWDNPEETLAEIRRLEGFLKQIKLSLEDSVK